MGTLVKKMKGEVEEFDILLYPLWLAPKQKFKRIQGGVNDL